MMGCGAGIGVDSAGTGAAGVGECRGCSGCSGYACTGARDMPGGRWVAGVVPMIEMAGNRPRWGMPRLSKCRDVVKRLGGIIGESVRDGCCKAL